MKNDTGKLRTQGKQWTETVSQSSTGIESRKDSKRKGQRQYVTFQCYSQSGTLNITPQTYKHPNMVMNKVKLNLKP